MDIVYTLVTAEVYQLCVFLLCSPRAAHFNALAGSNLADWITSIGLEAYADIISQLVGTGERLASISSNVEDLQVWTHVLHVINMYTCSFACAASWCCECATLQEASSGSGG